MKQIILVTGGQRSGKSTYAEHLALGLAAHPVYLATSRIWDDEFRRRVEAHKQRRGPQWTNIEEDRMLSRHDMTGRVVVVDCVTLWATNFFFDLQASAHRSAEGAAGLVEQVLQEVEDEFERFTQADATYIFVTNEIGSGGVSDNDVQRRFTDVEGWLNQYIAARADQVVLMVSGIPVKIKGK